MGCGCRKSGGRLGGQRALVPRQIRNGVSFRQGLRNVSTQSVQSQNNTTGNTTNKSVSAQGVTNEKTVRRGITRDRREIERKRRLAIAKRTGRNP